MKLLMRSSLSIGFICALTGCSQNLSLDQVEKPSSYDGTYYSYHSIIKENNEEAFTIENGKLYSESIKADIDEATMKLHSKKEKYTFEYNEGEFIVMNKQDEKVLFGYKKASKSYDYINNIYGKYSREIEPKLETIVRDHLEELVDGEYRNENYLSNIYKLNIKDKELSIYNNEIENDIKTAKLSLDKIELDQPKWDTKSIETIDERLIETYSNLKTISEIKDNMYFQVRFKLNNSASEYLQLKFFQYNSNEVGIIMQSNTILGEEIIDDKFEK